jgi:hypothetical protein
MNGRKCFILRFLNKRIEFNIRSKRDSEEFVSSLGLRFDNGYEETVDLSRRATTTPGSSPATHEVSNPPTQTPGPSTGNSNAASSSKKKLFQVILTPEAMNQITALQLKRQGQDNLKTIYKEVIGVYGSRVHGAKSAKIL